ncbi:bifunctional UDP-N-acetylglucosamine diphosphorylase/glucosamine-1-phosphate N-acetyltransferase GlmU [Companilactobacillus mishanensis]|uniref:Bifunctional protein GlmU n=1 Tax=Companilactobacillus mishanensis TaxID=2486008 RepID=A0ABW9P6U8_9LACO|nr:bifunctional UDP-N-acetylglucosamine diphosphorylase/glucosamine-1-phosphate N-acetyltransferase GlmU [Companilactobacillus mishanensis]MQS44973.1 bifunctional UDP-N-acetylglucosamine diphosphorylase/glucosamine-1-phosphate N-acetyltransferase GlmU [Companilactobacillus mishanensis]MQS89489.1 bifunctional UDP-N-acetylglucosamine diphosphorylase/glucosamine-1-phosphate N-acetyltransferase GlmU [Companilactobacillus mishanensis]
MSNRYVIILAAGKGTRMKSKLYKVLHPVAGKAMVDHVVTQVEKIKPDFVETVIGTGAEKVRDLLGDRTKYALQEEQLGTAHAVLQTEKDLGDKEGMTLIVNGDTPLFTADTFEKLFTYHEKQNAAVSILTAHAEDPFGYGRIIRDQKGNVSKIVEQKDASDEEKLIQEINTGVYCFDNKMLFENLHSVNNENAQGEYYLPDVVSILKSQGEKIVAYQMDDLSESLGVNDRVALSQAEKLMQKRINEAHMRDGVTIVDPESTYIDADVKIGNDTVVEPNTKIFGKTTIGSDCLVGLGSRLDNATIGNGVNIISSTIDSAVMHDGSDIGPNSHLRPKADIGEEVHIGNFCEVKNATVGARTKIGHLSYVGDATLGTDINVGCGVVFVNYDGVQKWHSNIGDHSFIGSNSNIVAPVEMEDHSFIAAGSTVNKDIPKHAMAIARPRQTNKENYWDRLPLSKSEEWK